MRALRVFSRSPVPTQQRPPAAMTATVEAGQRLLLTQRGPLGVGRGAPRGLSPLPVPSRTSPPSRPAPVPLGGRSQLPQPRDGVALSLDVGRDDSRAAPGTSACPDTSGQPEARPPAWTPTPLDLGHL